MFNVQVINIINRHHYRADSIYDIALVRVIKSTGRQSNLNGASGTLTIIARRIVTLKNNHCKIVYYFDINLLIRTFLIINRPANENNSNRIIIFASPKGILELSKSAKW